MDERGVPMAIEAEQALLGGLIQDPEQLTLIAEFVRPDDFARPEHARLYQLLHTLNAEGTGIDLVTVGERASRADGEDLYGGLSYVLQLVERVTSTANLRHYAEAVRDKSTFRRLIGETRKVLKEAFDESDTPEVLVERAAQSLLTLRSNDGRRSWTQVSEVIDAELSRIERIGEQGGGVTGTTTGFRDLDTKLNGWQATDLVVLAARPAMGKTALALNFALNAAVLGGVSVGVFSLEMSRGQLVTRLLSCLGEVDATRLRNGKLDAADWERLLNASETLRQHPIFIDDTPGVSLSDIRARARRLKTTHPNLGLIVLDYLQLMQGDDPRQPRQQQISDISRGLKILAKDLEVPVIALSQLNRGVEQRQEKRPMVSDLRESGAIEQDADLILFIYRDEYYHQDSADKGLAEVIIAKQRSGPTGTVKLAFRGNFARFDTVDDGGLSALDL